LGDVDADNVEMQRADPHSVLNLARDLIALRRREADLRRGRYRTIAAPDGVWAWERGERTIVVLNLSGEEAALPGVDGAVAVSTDRRRDGEAITGVLRSGPWEGVVVIGRRR
jgi:alpha-glucosidase